MQNWKMLIFTLNVFLLFLIFSSMGLATDVKQSLRKTILQTRHLGAHGMGYNTNSMEKMSKVISTSDIPILFELFAEPFSHKNHERNVRVGVQFALAALCRPGIDAILNATREGLFAEIDATDTLNLMRHFEKCDVETKSDADRAIAKVKQLAAERQDAIQKKIQEQKQKDARIQGNTLKLMEPKSSQVLSRTEREEAFIRSVKSAGLNGNRTPAQEKLYQQMYRTMVLENARPVGDSPNTSEEVKSEK